MQSEYGQTANARAFLSDMNPGSCPVASAFAVRHAMNTGVRIGFFLLLSASASWCEDEILDSTEAAATSSPGPARFSTQGDLFKRALNVTIDTRTEQAKTRAASTISVIDGHDLRQTRVPSLTDALRLLPGLEVLRTSSTGSNVNVRGYNDTASTAQGILALLDDRQVYNDYFGNVLWETIPVSLGQIDRIEVLRGPGSFLHGPNAMHGLINIVTRSPLDYDEDVVLLSAAGGSYRSGQTSLTSVKLFGDGDSGLKISATYDTINDFTPRDEGAQEKKSFEVRYGRIVGDDHVFEFTGGVAESQINVLLPSFSAIPRAELPSDIQESFLKANYRSGGLKAQISWTGFRSESVADGFYAPFEVELDTVTVDAHYTHKQGRHLLIVGGGHRLSSFDTRNQDISDGRHKATVASAFVQDRWEIVEQVFATAGARVDRHSNAGTNFSPRLALVWEFGSILEATEADDPDVGDSRGLLSRRQSLRASIGYGYRNPSLRESYSSLPVTGLTISNTATTTATVVGNKRLDAERIQSFEVGYFGLPVDRLKLGVTYYINRIKDLIVFQFKADGVDGPFFGVPQNQSQQEEAYGSEVEVEYLWNDSLSTFGNYSYGIRLRRGRSPVEGASADQRIPVAPRHKGSMGLRFSTSLPGVAVPSDEGSESRSDKGISGTVWVNYFGDTEFEGAKVSEYTMLNAQISYGFTVAGNEASIFLYGLNILDKRHREHPEGDEYGAILMAGFTLSW